MFSFVKQMSPISLFANFFPLVEMATLAVFLPPFTPRKYDQVLCLVVFLFFSLLANLPFSLLTC